MNRTHQRRMLDEVVALVEGFTGTLSEAVFCRIVEILLGGGSDPVIAEVPDGARTHAITELAMSCISGRRAARLRRAWLSALAVDGRAVLGHALPHGLHLRGKSGPLLRHGGLSARVLALGCFRFQGLFRLRGLAQLIDLCWHTEGFNVSAIRGRRPFKLFFLLEHLCLQFAVLFPQSLDLCCDLHRDFHEFGQRCHWCPKIVLTVGCRCLARGRRSTAGRCGRGTIIGIDLGSIDAGWRENGAYGGRHLTRRCRLRLSCANRRCRRNRLLRRTGAIFRCGTGWSTVPSADGSLWTGERKRNRTISDDNHCRVPILRNPHPIGYLHSTSEQEVKPARNPV